MKSVLFISLVAMVLSGCSHSMIMKQCKRVEGGDDIHVCKTMKPWE